MSFLLRECDVMDGANFFCCPRAVPLTLPELSLSPIHKLKLLFLLLQGSYSGYCSEQPMRHKLKKGAKVFIFARRQQIRINVSFK